MKVYAVYGKSWPLNHLFGFFDKSETAEASITQSPDYQDKLEVIVVNVNTTPVTFRRDV